MKKNNKIPWWHTEIGAPEKRSVSEAFAGRSFTMGRMTVELEERLSKFLNVPYVVATPSGSSAIILALLASGIKPGDEIITADLGWIATAQAAAILGAKVVFADCCLDHPLIDPQEVRKKITRKTKAVIPVHFNGRPCDMAVLRKIARDNRLVLIEDSCKALGSQFNGRSLGTIGDMGCFSLGMVSLVSCGYGGAVVTRSKERYALLRSLRVNGVPPGKEEVYANLGFSFKYSDILAAIGVAQMDRLPGKIVHLKKIYKEYAQGLQGLPFLDLIPVDIEAGQLPICAAFKSSLRKEILSYLLRHGISSLALHLPLHEAKYLNNHGRFPNASRFGREGFYLPCGPGQPLENVRRCIDVLRRWKG